MLPSQSTAWEGMRGKPFVWAQWLGGQLEGVCSAVAGGPQVQFQAVMARVKARILADIMLQQELKSLASQQILITERQKKRLFQMAPTATLTEWKKIPSEDVNTTVYQLGLQRGAYKLAATVGITPQFPMRSPTIELSFAEHPAPKPHA